MDKLKYICCLAIVLVFIVLSLFGCNTTQPISGEIYVDVIETDTSSPIDIEVVQDIDPCEGNPFCGPEWEYQKTCWITQYFFCNPYNYAPGDDSGLYKQKIIFDTCDADGIPCEQTEPDCNWTVINMGECENWLECDPTKTNLVIEEDVPCELEDGHGGLISGLQTFYCEKGQIVPGPCSPCREEICDSLDNDCDGVIDNLGIRECENECGLGELICVEGYDICIGNVPWEEVCDYIDNDCDNEIDEGQLNACGTCGDVPEDVCDGLDNDCNGSTDTHPIDGDKDGFLDPLLQACSTLCGEGYQICYNGKWNSCSAKAPFDEVCNQEDDDCDGATDENLDCSCPPGMADNPNTPENEGMIIPCLEEPLICGQGYKACICTTPACTATGMSDCRALCYFMPESLPPGEICDPDTGFAVNEICNNYDDDCDTAIDENLTAGCYTGPPGTLDIGICHAGTMICLEGAWGSYPGEGMPFAADYCVGQQGPLPEDLCNDADDNCDGIIEKVMEPTDILFVIDGSGSMSDDINAVIDALSMFAAHYSDSEVIKWGIIVAPAVGGKDYLKLATNLVSFQQFINVLINSINTGGSSEMLYDAVYLAIHNLVDEVSLPKPITTMTWSPYIGESVPPLQQFNINWRDDTNHVVITFSDEPAQTFMNPVITQQDIIDVAKNADSLFIYTFSPTAYQNSTNWQGNETGWEPIAINGSWYLLSNQAIIMFDSLMEIIDETACGGGSSEENN